MGQAAETEALAEVLERQPVDTHTIRPGEGLVAERKPVALRLTFQRSTYIDSTILQDRGLSVTFFAASSTPLNRMWYNVKLLISS